MSSPMENDGFLQSFCLWLTVVLLYVKASYITDNKGSKALKIASLSEAHIFLM